MSNVLHIGEVAARFGVTLRALRFWEQKGLIAPERRGAVRLYDRTQIQRVELINLYGRAGIGLRQIAKLLKFRDEGRFAARDKLLADLIAREEKALDEHLAGIARLKNAIAPAGRAA